MKLNDLDVQKVARAVEADASQPLPGLRKSLRQAKAGQYAAVHTPDAIAARRAGRPLGSTKADAKVAVKLRLDPDVLAVLRATGAGWQTRVNRVLRERFAL